jgi:hypothetical protein
VLGQHILEVVPGAPLLSLALLLLALALLSLLPLQIALVFLQGQRVPVEGV